MSSNNPKTRAITITAIVAVAWITLGYNIIVPLYQWTAGKILIVITCILINGGCSWLGIDTGKNKKTK